MASAWTVQPAPVHMWRGGSSPGYTSSSSIYQQTPMRPSVSRLYASSSTTITPEAEAQREVATLCNDAVSQQAKRSFGGIDFYDTSIDPRFRVLFVLGGPGAGKGTQSERMMEHYPVAHFSVGELLRGVPDSFPHKETIETALVAGQIVPVEISLALLQAAMEEARQTSGQQMLFLVDGFPRNYDNLIGWCRTMRNEAALQSVLVYSCPLPVLEQRIMERAKSSGRSDDNIESVQKRFRTFQDETTPAIEVMQTASQSTSQNRWGVVDINGNRPLDEVWSSTEEVLQRLVRDDVLTANAQLLRAIKDRDIETYQKLCDPAMFKDSDDASSVFDQQEVSSLVDSGDDTVRKASVEIITGRHACVSYERTLQLSDNTTSEIEEKRFWMHQGLGGWRLVHFVRKERPSTNMEPSEA